MNILTVSQVNRYLKSVLDELPPIQNLYISGEISNFKYYYQSKHMYFTLKDGSSQLKCVMFSGDNYRLKFKPDNGINVVCFGQICVYERDGTYQLYVRDMQPRGVGELAIAYEQLKAKLSNEGLFDDSNKKPIPRYPQKIGVATSNSGAAVEDIKNIISRRYPLCEVIIIPTLVQGESAPQDIAKALVLLDSIGVDTIIVGRGGGSIEDLYAFNTEIVARAIYNCKTPVISAVGHETDYTICDFVADLRAPTPSAGAELAVPDIAHEKQNISRYAESLKNLIDTKINDEQMRLDNIKHNSALSGGTALIESIAEKINDYNNKLRRCVADRLADKENLLRDRAGLLNALSPLAVLSRGYSIIKINDCVVTDVTQIGIGDIVNIKLNNGGLVATVNEVITDE